MAKAATTYTWQGKDRRGNSRKGEISAISLAEAKNLLRRQGISANKVKKLATPLFGKGAQKIVAADISKKLGTRVEVRPTLVSDPVMYRILVGPEHKDQIINVIADLMDLGISDYFLTRG